jgi:hypothetical protein
MKKMLFLFLAAGYCLTGIAKDMDTSWVDSPEGKIVVKKITILETKARIVLENGDKKTVPLDQISTYACEDKVFKKLPLYIDGKRTHQQVFMELVKIEGELELYKYSKLNYNPYIKSTSYLLYKGENLILEYDEPMNP